MIIYKGKPLLGEGSSVSNTSEFFAIAGTILFWLIFLIFSFVIKPQPKKQYKEVQIVLSSTPLVQKTEETPAPAEAASASAQSAQSQLVEESPAPAPAPAPEPVQKTVEKPAAKKNETSKPKVPSKPASKNTASEPEVYADDIMAAFEKQISQKREKQFRDDFFDDNESDETSNSEQRHIVNTENSISDKSAGIAASPDSPRVSSSSPNNSNTQNSSNSTKESLGVIRNTQFQGTAPNGIQSRTNVEARSSGSGRIEMKMSNGHSRALIDPNEPKINIPPELYHLIDTSRTVNISFKVVNSGNVTDVKITPESSLHSSIRQEIIGQLLFWRFEPADYTATATLEFTIVKK